MEHLAIDLGSRESQICVRTAEGEILEERSVATRSLGRYLAKRPKSRVVMESCAEAFSVADVAQTGGHEVVVVPAGLVRSLGVGQHGIKTDVRDSRNLSEASCRMSRLPAVHVPSRKSRDRKAMCGVREVLVESRTKLINSVRGWGRAQGLGRIRSGCPTTFTRRTREHLKQMGREVPEYVSRALATIDEMNGAVATADTELEELAGQDEDCQRLMTAPGIGPVTAVRFIAAVDQVERFPNAHKLESYLGLTPGEDSSCRRKRRTGVTKAGPKKVRWVLIQASWVARRTAGLVPGV
jgi:transposase